MKKTKFLVFWNPYEKNNFSKADFFAERFAMEENIVVIDLKNNKDPRSQSLLREADLVVVFLQQNEICLNHYFLHNLVRNEHVIYVIADYFYDGSKDWSWILERYRIPPEALFVLPYSNRLQFLEEHGGLDRIIEEEECTTPYEDLVGFSKRYRLLREKIYQSLR